MPRRNIDFADLDLTSGFAPREGGVGGIWEKVLGDDLDPAANRGTRTRLLRLDAGVQTPAAHAHDYWEELYVLSGSLLVADAKGEYRRVAAPAHACREPGFMHGPVRTDEACLLIEFSWYPDRQSPS